MFALLIMLYTLLYTMIFSVMLALFLTGIQWVYVFLGSAAILYILYKLLPVIIALFAKKISGK